MVDSRNFKKGNTNGKKKKNPIIPLIIIVVLAVLLLLLQYFMLDIMSAVYNQAETENTSMIIDAAKQIGLL
ncbi:MAG: hypothetical protein MR675_05085 [Lachnospira sp.]|nr:hypothetical protein [Lachnospira sp.]MDD5828087.1 hypothetical protein [Lachnospira sp.]